MSMPDPPPWVDQLGWLGFVLYALGHVLYVLWRHAQRVVVPSTQKEFEQRVEARLDDFGERLARLEGFLSRQGDD